MNGGETVFYSIADYHIQEELYEGNKAVVYRARRIETGQSVILKALKAEYPAPHDIAKYKREYEIAKSIDCDGVIRALDLVPYRNGVAIVLEDIDGQSLHRALAAQKLDLAAFLETAILLADALGGLHQCSVIHKDIKPHNVIVNLEEGLVRITDFGIASLLSSERQEMLTPDQLEGTLAYMSPEQTGRMNRAIDYRTDFYSLGITLYEMLVGQLPFYSEDPVEMIHCHIAKQPIPPHQMNVGIPKAISDIVMKCLAKDPDHRYQSAYGLKKDLETCLRRLLADGKIADFPIGEQDKSEIFRIPSKLYGREADLNNLYAVFDRVCQGMSEMVLVSGFSGIGKSAFVHEIHKPVIRERGFFLSGKFDPFKRHIPYYALIQALRQLVTQLLTESEEAAAAWKNKILLALGQIGQIMVDVIPELELIIGKQPAVPQLPPAETQVRFQLAMQNFMRVFARREHPVVMFLDDLHWADPASLTLIRYLMADLNTSYLLFIGAYRDNEVSSADRLMRMIAELQEKQLTLHHIVLTPLKDRHANQLLADTLQCEPERVAELTEHVMQKTSGNPFFFKQFLLSLEAKRLVHFDHVLGEWCWDLEQIRERGITDDVVEFMLHKIQKLPPYTQEVLKVAACIGSTFDFRTLTQSMNQTAAETADDLWSALQEGMVVPVGTSYKLLYSSQPEQLPDEFNVSFKFLHDRVQQVAYAQLPEVERKAVHWKLGQLMLERSGEEELENRLFDMVNHLNEGREYIQTPQDRETVMLMNLKAGVRAKASTAYEPALKYLRQGVDLLAEDCWHSQYKQAYRLSLERSEAEFLCGNFEIAEACFDLILQNAKTRLEKAQVYKIRTELYIAQGKYEDVIRIGLESINLLGIRMSGKAGKARLMWEVVQAKWNLRGHKVEDLIDLPFVSSPHYNEAMKILYNIATAAYFVDQELFALLNLKSLNMTLRRGNSIVGSLAYGGYSVFLGAMFGDFKNGYRFGKLAVEFNDRFFPEMKSKSDFSFATFCNHWMRPIRTSVDHYRIGYQASLESGDVLYAFFSALHLIHGLIIAGEPLPNILKEIETYHDFVRRTKLQDFKDNYVLLKGMVVNFLGDSADRLSLSHCGFDEAEYLEKMSRNENMSLQTYYYVCKLRVLYLAGEYEEALKMAREAEKILHSFLAQPIIPEFTFYYGLTLAALYGHASGGEQTRFRREWNRLLKQLRSWADEGPDNFFHKYLLVSAETARALGETERAMDLYDQAIESAYENGFLQNAAIAKECAAKFYLERGKERIAKMYLLDACYTYVKWGAVRKADELAKKYPRLTQSVWDAESRLETAAASSTVTTEGRRIDLVTVMKASRAISGEIVLDKLLENMIKIVVENAGAEKGVLLIERDGDLLVEAEKAVETSQVRVLQSIPFQRHEELPASVIQYVRRMKEHIVLHDATQEEIFSKDPYIRRRRPRSILCMPFLNQGRLVGVLYLENNLTTRAFTRDRLELMDLLSAQIAAAIENATLYQQQVQLTAAYGKFVPHQFLRFLNKQSITDVNVGDSIQTEMSVLFSDIRSFTAMSEKLPPEENFRFLNEYLSKMEPCIIENRGFIDKFIGDGIMSLFDKGADDAVRAAIAMLNRLHEYNAERRSRGESPIEIGLGINTGRLMLGTLGGNHRMDSTVISDAVNLASRMEGLTKLYHVALLISEETLRRLHDPNRYRIRLLDRVRVRGKTEAIAVYEVFDADPASLREEKMRTRPTFEAGVGLFQQDRYEEAQALFEECVLLVPEDGVAVQYVERCRAAQNRPSNTTYHEVYIV